MPDSCQGPFLGVLMLDTAFPRIPGDAGNAKTYHMPVRFKTVAGAGSLAIVKDTPPGQALVQAFCAAAMALETEGAVGIISTCGFLAFVQDDIARAVSVPVIASSLSLFPVIAAATGNRPVGILTASKTSLGKDILAAAQIPPGAVHIAGFEDVDAFASAILVKKAHQPSILQTAAIEKAAVEKAECLIAATPGIGAFLLECANLPPYAKAIRQATGRPVFSIIDAANLLWAAQG